MSSYIDAISQANTASNASTLTQATKNDSMGKEDFLALLVAQLQNQDPLNPDDPTEFTAQLAQFSSLEQLFTLNEGMTSLVDSNTNSDRLSALSTIGKEAAYQSDSFNFTGNPIEIGYQLDGQASKVTLALQQNGATIAVIEGSDLAAGNHFLKWDGLTKDGEQAPVGKYTIAISAIAAEGESISAKPLIKSVVTGVDLNTAVGGLLITMSGEVKFNDIIGVYEPGKNQASDEDEEEQAAETVSETIDAVADISDSVADLVD